MKKKFKRQCFWLKKLGTKWRKPRGRQSKLRREKKGRWAVPKIGYGTQRKEENKIMFKGERKSAVYVSNPKDLEKISPTEGVGIVSSSVGSKKAIEILKKAKEMGISIANLKLEKLEKASAKEKNKNGKKEEKK